MRRGTNGFSLCEVVGWGDLQVVPTTWRKFQVSKGFLSKY